MTQTDWQTAHRLTSSNLETVLYPNGAGYTQWGNLRLNRWADDEVLQGEGHFVFLKDAQSGEVWSATAQPIRLPDARYRVQFGARTTCFETIAHDIRSLLGIWLDEDAAIEYRVLEVQNLGTETRELDVTSFFEIALNSAPAFHSHPAFSRLFVQTEWDAKRGALLATRRKRSPNDPEMWLMHQFLGGVMPDAYETDRFAFIGRGRTLQHPAGLVSGLTNTAGSVLDQCMSLQKRIRVAPNQSVFIGWMTQVDASREVLEKQSDALRNQSAESLLMEVRQALTDGMEVNGWTKAAYQSAAYVFEGEKPPVNPEELAFWNGNGGFAANGREYVIRLQPQADGLYLPPLPWTNVVANEETGFLVSESGAGTTWSGNSRLNRLTPWANDPVLDPLADVVYVRDEDTQTFWSVTPQPVPQAVSYEVRHGFGYTVFCHESHQLRQRLTVFVDRHAPVKIGLLRLENRSDQARKLTIFRYAQWVLGGEAHLTKTQIQTEIGAERTVIRAENLQRPPFSDRVAFASVIGAPENVQALTDREAFLGRGGSMQAPAALLQSDFPEPISDDEPCAAFQIPIILPPHGVVELAFLLGEGSVEDVEATLAHFDTMKRVHQSLETVRTFWEETVSAVQIETPSEYINLMMNGWLTYQNLSCRIWARTAFYQSGGAFGYRDQLQDTGALFYISPAILRAQILLHAGHQFPEGDVMHWWHPPHAAGLRTTFSDDLLWLPFYTTFYVQSTGDRALLDEVTGFKTARALHDGEDEAFLIPENAAETATVYEHASRTIDRSLTKGVHGIPLMGCGDWNDGMSRVGREGRGESVFVGMFLYKILGDWIPICAERGDTARVERYTAFRHELGEALNDTGWDGEWYRRAYYDNGAVLGSKESDECQIDALSQAWAVISGVASAERTAQSLEAMKRHLVDEEAGLIRLLTPAFDQTPHDPGYIKGYLPGIRENGGQYTHGILWGVKALAENHYETDAARFLEFLTPIWHTETPDRTAIYQTEPYVIAADVYGVAPHVGRGGWTWYTGSAGWYFRVVLESVLGLSLVDGTSLALNPHIPADWDGFKLNYRAPDGKTHYRIHVRQSDAWSIEMDGQSLSTEQGIQIPLLTDGALHEVVIQVKRK